MRLDLPDVAVPDAEERVRAWEQRCAVSHAGHFVPMRPRSVAFAAPRRPVEELRVALASSGGVHTVDQEPFDLRSPAGDDSVRWVPSDAPARDLRFADDHYDHGDADADPNCMLPLERLHELARDGMIGSVAPRHLGFMGFIPNAARFVEEVVPEVIDVLRQDDVDAVVLGPGCPMCHRTVALAQNLIEAAGIPTVSVSLSPSLTLGHGVPRALHARFPFGNTFGEPHDVWTQRAMLRALLAWTVEAPAPNLLRRLPYSWSSRAVAEDRDECDDGACFVPRAGDAPAPS